MKKEAFGEATWREVSPLGRIPRKYINKFLNKDPEAVAFVKEWIDRNGRIILFTQGKAKGWERVWATDEGKIYMNDDDHPPTSEELDARIRHVSYYGVYPLREDLLGKGVPLLDKLEYLKAHERPL